MKSLDGTVDLDRSTRPGKWQKRGVQPEVAPKPPSPMERIRDLMDEIRLEKDPAKKALLERKFQEQCRAFDMIDGKSLPVDIYRLYEEITESFAIALPNPQAVKVPENIGKQEWTAMHKALLECRNKASQWLSQSRRFAVDKWGADFLAETELQLELDLGIERKPETPRIEVDNTMRKIESIAKTITKWKAESGNFRSWDKAKLEQAIATLEPVADAYAELTRLLEEG